MRINIYDQDTLEYLKAKGIEGELFHRVQVALEENAAYHKEIARLNAKLDSTQSELNRLRTLEAAVVEAVEALPYKKSEQT